MSLLLLFFFFKNVYINIASVALITFPASLQLAFAKSPLDPLAKMNSDASVSCTEAPSDFSSSSLTGC